MADMILLAAAVIAMVAALVALIRFLKGPSSVDRVISFDTMTIIAISLIAVTAHFAGRVIYIDVAVVYGLLSFLGVIVIARYIEKGL